MNPEKVIRALWCRDSETGEEVLVDLDANKIIAKCIDGKIVDPDIKPEVKPDVKS